MWVVFALAASMFWGVTYTLSERIYSKISIPTSLGISSVLSGLGVLLFAWIMGLIGRDITTLANSGSLSKMLIAETIALTLAEVLVGVAISTKSATLAGLIEISYPIFIAIFTWVLFKENHLNIPTAIGGLCIFTGVFVIYYFNR